MESKYTSYSNYIQLQRFKNMIYSKLQQLQKEVKATTSSYTQLLNYKNYIKTIYQLQILFINLLIIKHLSHL